MSDIVERLRTEGANAMRVHLSMGMHKLCTEAADEIERLRAKLKTTEAERDQSIIINGNLQTKLDRLEAPVAWREAELERLRARKAELSVALANLDQ